MTNMTPFWLALGFLGQSLYGVRIIVQWISSERLKCSIVPASFWYISVLAGAILLSYAIWRRDPVFIFNEAFCLFIYIRNIIMHRKNPEKPTV